MIQKRYIYTINYYYSFVFEIYTSYIYILQKLVFKPLQVKKKGLKMINHILFMILYLNYCNTNPTLFGSIDGHFQLYK